MNKCRRRKARARRRRARMWTFDIETQPLWRFASNPYRHNPFTFAYVNHEEQVVSWWRG